MSTEPRSVTVYVEGEDGVPLEEMIEEFLISKGVSILSEDQYFEMIEEEEL